MVVKMMKWRPWPLSGPRKYQVRLVVQKMEGWDLVHEGGEDKGRNSEKLTVEIRWKGTKFALSPLRRTVKRNFTKEVEVFGGENGVVGWDEEFQSLCTLSPQKDNVFHPWEIAFTVLNISLSLLELRTAPEATEPLQRAIVPVSSPPQSGETVSTEKDELSAIKAGLRKVKIFTDYVSTRRAKKACHEEEGSEGRCSARSEEGEYNYPLDSNSSDDFEEGESDDIKEDSTVRKSFSYGTLAYANCAGGSFQSDMSKNGENEDWVYYSNRKSDVGSSHIDDLTQISEPSVLQSSRRSILSWRKRKLSFRSPKTKGEPLLKKAYGEEGGDDIDFDRRQLSSDDNGALVPHKADEDSSANRSSVSDFGDDNFAVGSWESKEIISRDGHMMLQTEVFFASIDQRSEQAAGESACTALVAVIADWFQNNLDIMPIKSQFDSLIREGSLEWRNLCEKETYREQFPDKHFDLETVLQAKIRSLSVVPGKSFIGFFHPDGMDEGRFDFLLGAMSFDNIWDEISGTGSEHPSNDEPQVYIVSWNDHFFILKVEPEAYYIIDTLGERLYEGCNQAYILKFDSNTVIRKLPNVAQPSDEKTLADQPVVAVDVEPKDQQVNKEEASVSGAVVIKPQEPMKSEEEGEVVCQGKNSCKEYIKSFLAAIPIRELQADIKKGLMASTPLHHRLQIEFHYTQHLQALPETHAAAAAAMPMVAPLESNEVAIE
ncbi:hypothetical protein MANES_09G043400v8 [Manihot esculenta]|uniref:Uncharacterized protein n=1 Tax=Manihot esculenta TaxID=3983 RepID=A0ACB7H7S2_MANES|nr:hypothetical protein MANES_09G043400v8 [Manihot esculenta]